MKGSQASTKETQQGRPDGGFVERIANLERELLPLSEELKKEPLLEKDRTKMASAVGMEEENLQSIEEYLSLSEMKMEPTKDNNESPKAHKENRGSQAIRQRSPAIRYARQQNEKAQNITPKNSFERREVAQQQQNNFAGNTGARGTKEPHKQIRILKIKEASIRTEKTPINKKELALAQSNFQFDKINIGDSAKELETDRKGDPTQ